MTTKPTLILTAAVFGFATPVLSQSLPADVLGSWDVSVEACQTDGTPMTRIDINADTINTYGGNALISEVDQSGSVVFIAADFQQTEGAMETEERARTYFRLTPHDGPDRLNFVWKDVQAVDLVRCSPEPAEPSGEMSADDAVNQAEKTLPIDTGLWVIAGGNCENPSNASLRIYDGRGLYGSQSKSCEVDGVSNEGNRYTIDQTCIATYDGSSSTYRDTVNFQNPKRFSLTEDGETATQNFEWCGPRLQP